MEKEIVWTKNAADKFFNIIEFLYEEWSEKTALDFFRPRRMAGKIVTNLSSLRSTLRKEKGTEKIHLVKAKCHDL